MTEQDLHRGNEIQEEIRELENFIRDAKSVWKGKIIQKKYIFYTIPYGGLGGKEYPMNTEIKNRVLRVLEDYLGELKTELESL